MRRITLGEILGLIHNSKETVWVGVVSEQGDQYTVTGDVASLLALLHGKTLSTNVISVGIVEGCVAVGTKEEADEQVSCAESDR